MATAISSTLDVGSGDRNSTEKLLFRQYALNPKVLLPSPTSTRLLQKRLLRGTGQLACGQISIWPKGKEALKIPLLSVTLCPLLFPQDRRVASVSFPTETLPDLDVQASRIRLLLMANREILLQAFLCQSCFYPHLKSFIHSTDPLLDRFQIPGGQRCSMLRRQVV